MIVFFRILRLIAVPLMDSILDAVYFLHLGSEYILVHMPPSVIKLMCAFLFIAALKDILISWLIKFLHNDGARPDPEKEHEFKILEIMTCFIMEDLFQVWLQYFYFEKYRFEQTITFYVNAGNRSFSSEYYAKSRLLRRLTAYVLVRHFVGRPMEYKAGVSV